MYGTQVALGYLVGKVSKVSQLYEFTLNSGVSVKRESSPSAPV